MFTVIGNIIACVFWGVLISSILTGLLFCLPKAIHMRFRIYPSLYPVANYLFPLFGFPGHLVNWRIQSQKIYKDGRKPGHIRTSGNRLFAGKLTSGRVRHTDRQAERSTPHTRSIPARCHRQTETVRQTTLFAGPAGTRSRQNDTDRNQPIYMEKKRMDNSGFSSLRFSFGFECSETGPEKKRTKEEL